MAPDMEALISGSNSLASVPGLICLLLPFSISTSNGTNSRVSSLLVVP